MKRGGIKPIGRKRVGMLLLLALSGLSPFNESSHARFLEADADRIDPEERLGLESYNDLTSYRYPAAAWLLWDESDTGFRVSAGSLNASRFLYSQDIKFSTERGQAGSFAFKQTRREDVTEQREVNEIRATLMPVGALEVSLLGDSGTFKEYGDLGFAVGLFRDRQHWFEFFYWSVDHYYATKKSDPGDHRPQRAWSAGVRGGWSWNEDLRLIAEFEYDSPLNWERASRGYIYEYQRRAASVRLQKGLKQAGLYQFELSAESKRESKDWRTYTSEPSSQYKKNLERQILFAEATWFRVETAVDYEVGGALFLRRAQYIHHLPEGVTMDSDAAESLPEEPSPDSKRVEPALFWSINRPMFNDQSGAGKHRFQYGMHANDVHIDERHGYKNTEVKAQAAWEYRYSDKASAFLNTSWDLDQLAHDFPYRQGQFRPWGGGNIQFTAIF